ncbi:MAG TPA: hypothetical protein VGQ68_02985 [Gaiellaceae bacterium]|jgi:hypothetical protein|nr:hypothetical protein [Gaiellaceae bacterium]
MEDRRGRRRDLTPLSGELEARAEWTPPGPVAEQHRPKKEKAPPATWSGALLSGLRRFILILALLAALLGGAALLLVQLSDTEPSRAFPLAFYLGGAVITLGGFLHAAGSSAPYYFEREEREAAFTMSFAYVAFGVALVVIGAVLDSVL